MTDLAPTNRQAMQTNRCSVCGAPLAADAPFGHCPVCLLSLPLDVPPPRKEPGTSTLGGERIIGDYQLLNQLGRGGMGVVYRARQISLNRTVAVKMLLNSALSSPAMVRRFEMEAETVARLDHPHIVPIYEVREEHGQRYFSMKLIEGESLAQQIKRKEFVAHPIGKTRKASTWPQTHERIARLMTALSRAVDYAHQKGVLHRDLKPANILIDGPGEPHLTDFGLAKVGADGNLTESGTVMGTPCYMAPEQASGGCATVATDVYSLGALFYELLTSRPPFEGTTPIETLRRVVDDEAPQPKTVNAHVDRDLAVICMKALEKNPLRRYASAGELADDVERWLRHEPVSARSASVWLRTNRWTRRNRVGTALILTLCIGLGATGWLLRVVDNQRVKESRARHEIEKVNGENAELVHETVGLLRGNLDGLWASTDKRYLVLRSEQLAALSARPIIKVTNKTSLVRFRAGITANESPVDEARRYADLFAYLEKKMSESLGKEVRFDIKLYKFPGERLDALTSGELDFARTGAFHALKAISDKQPIRALVEQVNPGKLAVFFTRTNSGIKSLADLKGKAMAFGETNATISFVAQAKLAEVGITATNLSKYDFFDSRTEFMEDVLERGFDEAVKRVGELNSHAEVIERVIDGTYDAGVSNLRAFEKNQRRGLVMIPGTVFENIRNFYLGSASLPAEAAESFIAAMTALQHEDFLRTLPAQPTGYRAITEETHAPERAAMRRIEGLFPWKPALTSEPPAPRSNLK